MNVAKRTKTLKALLNLRLGPGAALLSPSVTRLHLTFAYKLNDGHFGARKVWRLYLPRLKYHNPAVSMTVARHTDQDGPATLSVYFAPLLEAGAAGKGAQASGDEMEGDEGRVQMVQMVDMKHKHENEILERLMVLGEGRQVEATEEEREEMRVLEEERRFAMRDREEQREVNRVRKEEKKLLELAAGSVS